MALRYINRINIPLPFTDFKQYLRTTPEIARELPQGLSTFLMRLVIPMDHFESIVTAGQWLESKVSIGGTSSVRLAEQLEAARTSLRALDP